MKKINNLLNNVSSKSKLPLWFICGFVFLIALMYIVLGIIAFTR